jgi:hypothetical protein
VSADGSAVREDDAEPELLEDDSEELRTGDIVTVVVKDLMWETFPEAFVRVSEEGAVATMTANSGKAVGTSNVKLTNGKHYWEVELLSTRVNNIMIGICRPGLGPKGIYEQGFLDCAEGSEGWFVSAMTGGLYGDGKNGEDRAGSYKQGDRVGILLDLEDGSLRFFKNGEQHGHGYPAGSVMGPVSHAVQMRWSGQSVRMLSR